MNNPESILLRMSMAYAQCASYGDTGCVTTQFLSSEGKLEFTSEQPFTTAFIRPDRFRFEFKSTHPYQTKWHRYIIWAFQDDVRIWWDIRPGIETDSTLTMAIAGATGISSGSAHTVPRMLIPDIEGRSLTDDLTDLRKLEDDFINGIACYRIQGRYISDPADREAFRAEVLQETGKDPGNVEEDPKFLWIEKNTYLLRRIENRFWHGTFHTEHVTTYEPQMGGPIDEDQLRFVPPDLRATDKPE